MISRVLGQGDRPFSTYVLSLRNPSHVRMKAVRADRATKLGNPFIVGVHGIRGECCRKHSVWLDTGERFGNPAATEERRQWVLKNVKLHKGEYFICWCAPDLCHCEKLAELANKD